MLISLRLSNILESSFPEVEFDPEFDDARSIIASICEAIEEMKIAEFRVSGFGEDEWPVDVSTDLATLVEQLPEALVVLEKHEGEFRIDFYEQGIERLIFGQCSGENSELRCQSLTDWQPSPPSERMRTSDIAAMLGSVHRQFLNVALATPMSDAARRALTAWAVPRRLAA